ncbi:MAG: hypothetical protein H8E25_06385 [Planctomycetes bacterium]|nr:hypothetical protein [Planctomycetota bacterium]
MIRYFLPLLLALGSCQAPNQYDADGNVIATASACADSADCSMGGDCDKDGDCPMQEACDAGVTACADKGDADCDKMGTEECSMGGDMGKEGMRAKMHAKMMSMSEEDRLSMMGMNMSEEDRAAMHEKMMAMTPEQRAGMRDAMMARMGGNMKESCEMGGKMEGCDMEGKKADCDKMGSADCPMGGAAKSDCAEGEDCSMGDACKDGDCPMQEACDAGVSGCSDKPAAEEAPCNGVVVIVGSQIQYTPCDLEECEEEDKE